MIGDHDDLLGRIVRYFMASATDAILFGSEFVPKDAVPGSIDYSKYFGNIKIEQKWDFY